jgi:hypothetical protein
MTTINKRFVQAYKQAPWRMRAQKGALFLIGVFLAACIIWVMLTVSVEAATAGLDIQAMTSEKQSMTREIADLRSKIAVATSSEVMAKHAADIGFRPATTEDLTYITVPGYVGRQPKISAPPPGSELPPMLIKPSYTQSLSDWLWQGMTKLGENPGITIK